jgi:hypothetical protein
MLSREEIEYFLSLPYLFREEIDLLLSIVSNDGIRYSIGLPIYSFEESGIDSIRIETKDGYKYIDSSYALDSDNWFRRDLFKDLHTGGVVDAFSKRMKSFIGNVPSEGDESAYDLYLFMPVIDDSYYNAILNYCKCYSIDLDKFTIDDSCQSLLIRSISLFHELYKYRYECARVSLYDLLGSGMADIYPLGDKNILKISDISGLIPLMQNYKLYNSYGKLISLSDIMYYQNNNLYRNLNLYALNEIELGYIDFLEGRFDIVLELGN